MFYERVFRQLNKCRVKYLVAGGVAVNLYGVPRFTNDLDILIDFSKNNVLKLGKAMKACGFSPKVPVKLEDLSKAETRKDWIEKRNMKVFSFCDLEPPHQLVDILILAKIDFKTAYAKRTEMKAGDVTVPLVSLKDLIKLKKNAGRKQDMGDLEMLRKILRVKQREKK